MLLARVSSAAKQQRDNFLNFFERAVDDLGSVEERAATLADLARLARRRGECSVAEGLWGRALALAPQQTEWRREYGELLEANGHSARALQLYSEATSVTDALLERVTRGGEGERREADD